MKVHTSPSGKRTLRVQVRTTRGTVLKVVPAPRLSAEGRRRIREITEWERRSADLVRQVSGPLK